MSGPLRCPYCRQEYDEPFKVCVRCGRDLKSGKFLEPVVVEGDEEDDAPGRPPLGRLAAAWVAEYLPGLFRPTVLIASVLLGVIGLGIVVFGVVLVLMGVLIGALAAASCGGIAYAQAAAWVLTGEFQKLTDCLVDFDGTRWMLWFILLMLPGTGFIIAAAQYAGR